MIKETKMHMIERTAALSLFPSKKKKESNYYQELLEIEKEMGVVRIMS